MCVSVIHRLDRDRLVARPRAVLTARRPVTPFVLSAFGGMLDLAIFTRVATALSDCLVSVFCPTIEDIVYCSWNSDRH